MGDRTGRGKMGQRMGVERSHDPKLAHVLGGQVRGADLSALLAACRHVRAESRQTLLRAEDDRALLLLSGAAKASILTPDGDEVITEIVGPGHAANLLTVLGHSETGRDITSLEPVEALSISGRDLHHLLRTTPAITSACLWTVAEQHASTNADRARFAGTCIAERVAQRLLELATRWGEPDGAGVRIDLPLTQEELAAWSGASRESVAKVLQSLRASGVLTTGRRSMRVLDLAALQARCGRPSGGNGYPLLAAPA